MLFKLKTSLFIICISIFLVTCGFQKRPSWKLSGRSIDSLENSIEQSEDISSLINMNKNKRPSWKIGRSVDNSYDSEHLNLNYLKHFLKLLKETE
jgi:hypothetical protein